MRVGWRRCSPGSAPTDLSGRLKAGQTRRSRLQRHRPVYEPVGLVQTDRPNAGCPKARIELAQPRLRFTWVWNVRLIDGGSAFGNRAEPAVGHPTPSHLASMGHRRRCLGEVAPTMARSFSITLPRVESMPAIVSGDSLRPATAALLVNDQGGNRQWRWRRCRSAAPTPRQAGPW